MEENCTENAVFSHLDLQTKVKEIISLLFYPFFSLN